MRHAILALILIFSIPVSACINTPLITLKNGTTLYHETEGNVPWGHDFFTTEDHYAADIHAIDSLFEVSKDPIYLIEKGVLLIISEEYQKAINLYLRIEQEHPGKYATASNLGTAYELAGDNENALHWIKRAIQIDSSSHFNSEWIHVTILQAKIKGPAFVTTRHLLNTDFGDGPMPESPMSAPELNMLHKALFYQLDERMSFVKPTDPIVARLLFDLGNVAFLLKHFDDAGKDYELAVDYGFGDDLMAIRKAELESWRNGEGGTVHRTNGLIVIAGSIGLIIGVLGFSAWRAGKK